ncbi:LysR family transcriptional regulator [Aquimarina hainanensis]|uniref:LysR family transcriptional regulator n=1 Tax=Aquimarina hainanensis TaxID=1578017 RepID=A0ABW5NEB2_9FLAO|nr:LysR family transcriptional regulator [Aquimarina sp. TRL1]QKX06625.1 LysR family transcriptional regulator [Aquimarina sp. TRL1]
MNFNQLKYIIAVDKFKNFNRAAIECEIAQSTLSREVQRLEKEHDIIIFDRSRQPVVPTLKGEELIQMAKEILKLKRRFVAIAETKKNEVSGSINLAIAEILAPYITPVFINSITKKYPKLKINIMELSDRKIEDDLSSEAIDAAIMVAPSLSHDYHQQFLFKESLILYSSDHQSLKKNRENNSFNFNSITLHEDIKELLLKMNDDTITKCINEEVNVTYAKGNLETIRNVIDYNKGSTLLPKLSLLYMRPDVMNKVYTFSESSHELKINLITSRGFHKKRITKILSNEIKDNIKRVNGLYAYFKPMRSCVPS